MRPKPKLTLAGILLTGCALLSIVSLVVAQQMTNKRKAEPKAVYATASVSEVTSRLERDIPALMKEANVPGLSIALIRGGEVAWQHAFGVKDAKTHEAVNDNTVFEAASLSPKACCQ